MIIENTRADNNMISFYEAHLTGFDVIELDVQLCSTGQIVVYHDTYINNKFIADTSFEELKLLNIPTLNEVFKWMNLWNSLF